MEGVRIVRVEPVSLIDYPGQVSSVFFVAGCALACDWCQNKDLINWQGPTMGLDEALKLVPKEVKAIVFSGGEPFEYGLDLTDAIDALHDRGYKVAIHTNGIDANSLAIRKADYIAMDIKGPYYKNGLQAAMVFVLLFAKDYEFRTTAHPELTYDDVLRIGHMLSGFSAKTFFLQPYIGSKKSLTVEDLKAIWNEIGHMFENGGVRA